MPAVSYNSEKGIGYGSTGYGGLNQYYPNYNYDAPEQNATNAIANIFRPQYPRFYHGTLNEAKDLLVASSKYNNTEMGMYYFKDHGYYFEDSYGYLAKPFYAGDPSSDSWSYSHFDGYYKYFYGENSIRRTWTYSLHPKRNEVYIPNGLHPRQNIGRPNAFFHTHPSSYYLSDGDISWMEKTGIPIWAVGWDGIIRGIRDVFHFLLPGVEIRR